MVSLGSDAVLLLTKVTCAGFDTVLFSTERLVSLMRQLYDLPKSYLERRKSAKMMPKAKFMTENIRVTSNACSIRYLMVFAVQHQFLHIAASFHRNLTVNRCVTKCFSNSRGPK